MSTFSCPHCHHEANDFMRFCPVCGGQISKPTLNETPICPRCDSPLEKQTYQGGDIHVCPNHHGMWLSNMDFKKYTSERNVYKDDTIPYEYLRKPLPEEQGYIKCAFCRSRMVRKNFKNISGILIDICIDHGIWLDDGELEQIRTFVANGGLDEAQDRDINQNKQAIQATANEVKNVAFMQKLLNFRNVKYWLFR